MELENTLLVWQISIDRDKGSSEGEKKKAPNERGGHARLWWRPTKTYYVHQHMWIQAQKKGLERVDVKRLGRELSCGKRRNG